MQVEFDAELVRWDARREAWYFLWLPEELSADIHELPAPPRGFGALRVRVRVGSSEWMTSIFFSRTAYCLPVKKSVRQAEGLGEGDFAHVSLTIVDL